MGAGERKRERGRDDLVWGRGRERDGETYGRIEPGSRREKMNLVGDQTRGGAGMCLHVQRTVGLDWGKQGAEEFWAGRN